MSKLGNCSGDLATDRTCTFIGTAYFGNTMFELSERVTRKQFIDKKLRALGWTILPFRDDLDNSKLSNHAVEEYPTSKGPCDYALFVKGKLLGLIEAKKLAVGARNVLEQAKRYAEGVVHQTGQWGTYMVPFLYSSNGELVFHLDVREPNNASRELKDFHSPDALWEHWQGNQSEAVAWLQSNRIADERLRPYQRDAIEAVELELAKGNRTMMLAMATGTGKTFTIVSSIYRMLRSHVAKRILFLVDRRSLASQAGIAFNAYDTPTGNKFSQEYEVYHQRFRAKELEESEFNPTELPTNYLTQPDASKTFVYVSTIQRLALQLLGKDAVIGLDLGDDDDESDAEELRIPIHAFDVIIADECHRGYTSKETNVWRTVLDYFDAVKIGLTATPAAHTVAYFGDPVYKYSTRRAVEEGFLVDYDAVAVNSKVLMEGAFLKQGELVGIVDTEKGGEQLDRLEDEREFDSGDIERKITAPDTNKKVIAEIKKHADAFQAEHGRIPKTLIFAQNDLPHTSHSDSLVSICKELWREQGDDFVVKITGSPSVDNPLKLIKKFRNRPEPGIVVSVDMLSTGVDIPWLEYIVFLRPVKSRILWEQMLGRGTRLCPSINKEKFTVFDCFNGTLFEYFRNASNNPPDELGKESVTINQIIENIWQNRDREFNINRLIGRLRRIERAMSGDAMNMFAAYVPDGDLKRFSDELRENLSSNFKGTMEVLRNQGFQDLLINYPRAKKPFWKGYEVQDEVSSETIFKVGERSMKPDDYLKEFSQFVRNNHDKIEAMQITLNKPAGWSTSVLRGLREALIKNHFEEKTLRLAHDKVYKKPLADLISMIKHAFSVQQPLLNVDERVDRAIGKVVGDRVLSTEQKEWMGYIREHLVENLTLDTEDFDLAPVFERRGGLGKFRRAFAGDHESIIQMINENIAA